ncbi:MAG: preprotein translocase subunit SecE [Candidatus Yanofskybacteria bacterium RIFCSPHIGHO2_02_FULL_50_12]|uniref:Protein translocase subunit SecE n=1 Tax=Candidatus Yanofskybacteria bacterium RIFCSPHIGHO2_02_FULL_50_12 TaxID=1802685 RepID=A0A1F8FWQ3_9BACT|nr:MAG: preprotein translocase subunit SecE [Candidatus Yanofskybacteria bacterium RIFCSPHIGHO2_02_FULL_50_12]
MASIGQFLKEVRVEMAKVSWPTRTQLVAYTFVVIILSALMAAFLGLLDLGFQAALRNFLLK